MKAKGEIVLSKLKRLAALVLAVLISAFTAGCDMGMLEITGDPDSGISISYQSPESIQPTDTSEESSDASTEAPSDVSTDVSTDASYTMADIKKLKNTGHFAKNTLEHIFDGTINGKGKATGYHYTMVTDSKGRVVEGSRSEVDENGVFTGKVEVSGVRKNGFSSFFPESWTPQQVVDAINTAYDDATENSNNPKGTLWIGYCGDLEIDMYLDSDMKIVSAFPIYEGD